MMQYDVPFVSQYTDLGQHEWRARGCGIAALKMVLDFWHAKNTANRTDSLDALLKAGLTAGAYVKGVGWTHRGLVDLAKGYGYDGFNVDLAAKGPTPKSPAEAWQSLTEELAHGPVMASVYSRLDPDRGGGHIVVLTGMHDELVFINDPEEMSAREGHKALALEAFLPAFKLRYMVIRSK